MREKIQNRLKISVDGVDLTKLRDIEFYVKQTGFFGCYAPELISSTEMLVIVPYKDAMRLRKGNVDLQFAFVNEYGDPDASNVNTVTVEQLLKEAGYDPL